MKHSRVWGIMAILLPALVNTGASAGYSPAQIRHAYGFDQLTADGTGQTIGIVVPYGNPSIQTDLDTFCANFGLPSTQVQVLGNNTGAAGGWELPATAAVEWAHVIAPNANIVFSVSPSESVTNDLLYAVTNAVDAGSSVVSMGWGTTEFPGISLLDSYFQTPGVTYVAASGDFAEDSVGPELEWPAASPYVLSVGGTSLYLDVNGNRVSETAWPSSGGGLSASYETPTWQVGWSPYLKRGAPDVSYVADPNTGFLVYVSAFGGWRTMGGTSIGAAQWAALIALANQSRSSGVSGNRDIYKVAGSAPNINSANFFDITSGSNGADPDDLSVTGYDLVTGLGSPVATGLVPALAALPVTGDFSLSVTPGSQTVAQKGTANYTVTVTAGDGFSDPVDLSVSGLPADASFAFTPLGVTGSGQVTLSITAGVTSGSFSIIATGGGITHVTAATLVVLPPDFSISASPASVSVKHGASPSYNITVAPLYGFTGSVTLSAAESPNVANGPVVSFKPQPINGGSGSSQMSVKTVGNTPRGSYTITLTGTSGTTSHSTTVSITVN